MIYDGYHIYTPGPVKMSDEILKIGAKQTPYFRNSSFSDVTLFCEKSILEMLNAPSSSRVIFLTASGTAGMESVVMNLLDSSDRALVVNGGGFGSRFVDICQVHDTPHFDLKVENSNLSDIESLKFDGEFSSLIVNAHETSVGHIYDLDALGRFSKERDLLYIVDAISSFITDPLDMSAQNIDVVILSSQKALALPPGLCMVVLSPKAIDRLKEIRSLYFNFKDYLLDGKRGQTPYTPAVTIMLQLEVRLKEIIRDGGVEESIKKAERLARYFRQKIEPLPLKEYTEFMPNAMTTLTPTDNKSAYKIVKDLEERYRVVVCPNGGELRDKIFRVSHMGDMDESYMDTLIKALFDYYKSDL